MLNKILCIVLNTLTAILLGVVLVTLSKSIKIQEQQFIKVSAIEQKLQGLDIQCVQEK